MKLYKTLLAWAMASTLGISAAQAVQVSTVVPVTGSVDGEMSISSGTLNLGNKTKIVINSGGLIDHVVTTFCTEGMTCTIYPDTPGSAAWNLDGGTARNVSGSGKEVKLTFFRDDGVTPWTPTNGWTFLGTGADQTFTAKARHRVDNGTGLGVIDAVLNMTIAN